MNEVNHAFLRYMKEKPAVYEKSSSAFWDDENISKYMLEAHLDQEADGATRKREFVRKSVDWICGYCGVGTGKTLLDLGCGSGIYAELLAEKGFCVTGIDFSARSIQYAKQHAVERHMNIRYHYQNYLEMDYLEEFDVIILIYCDFGVLAPEDRAVLLKKCRKALKDGGVLFLDGWADNFLSAFEEKDSVGYEERGFWSEKPHAVIQRNTVYPESQNTLEQYVVVTEESCECYNIWNQVYSRETLEAEIRDAGFETPEFYDDAAGKVFTGKGETICAVIRKKYSGERQA